MAKRLLYTLVAFAIALAIIAVARPAPAFDEAGRARRFGAGPGETLLSVGVLAALAGAASFAAFLLIDLRAAPAAGLRARWGS